jgi:hypothetical protein
MSQENVEIVRTALTALEQRDVELYISVASPEIELVTPAAPWRARTLDMREYGVSSVRWRHLPGRAGSRLRTSEPWDRKSWPSSP